MAEALLCAGLTTLAGLLFLTKDLAFSARFTQDAIRIFLHNFSAVYLPNYIGYDHSIWAFCKVLIRSHPRLTLHLLSAYTPSAELAA